MIKINHKILSQPLEKRLLAVNIVNTTSLNKNQGSILSDVLITVALVVIISWMV